MCQLAAESSALWLLVVPLQARTVAGCAAGRTAAVAALEGLSSLFALSLSLFPSLFLSLYDLAPLVDSGLLRCFPLLRELTLEVVMFEMAQLMRLTAQCPQLVRLSVTFSPRIMGVSEILAFADVAALVSRLPYLRSLLLDLRMDYLSLDDICELIPDIERPETLILLPAVQLLLPVVQQLTTLGLHVDEELLHSLREDAPWCTIQRLTSSATVWEWSHVEQALRRSEQAHKRKLEEDSEASPQTRPKI